MAALLVALPGGARALDISDVIDQVIVNVQSFFQTGSDSNAPSIVQGQNVTSISPTSTQTATYDPVSGPVAAPGIANGVPIVTGGDAVTSKASLIAVGTINQSSEQRLSVQQIQEAKNAGAIAQSQVVGLPFANTASQSATSAASLGPTSAGAVNNSAELEAGGDAVVSEAAVDASTTINQTIKQNNSANQSQKAKNAGTIVPQSQIAGEPFTNTASQAATAAQVVGTTASGPVSNSGEVEAGGDAVASKASANAGATINQTIKQGNSAQQSQKAKNSGTITQSEIAGQPFTNTASQSATAAPPVSATSSGPVSNSGEVEADGDAVASKASVDASATINQTIKQNNSADQSQKAKNAGTIGQSEIAGQPFTNTASQSATAAPPVDPTASGPVSNSGEVEADGDAVASKASVDASATINQTIKQGNSAKQSQKAEDSDSTISQGQTAGQPFTNTASQSATAAPPVGTIVSGPVANGAEVEADGDAVASKASVDASATINQTIKQNNSADQSQKAKSAGAIGQSENAGQPFSNTASQSATAAPPVGPTASGPANNEGEVKADGDAVASKAGVDASATINQTIKQGNSAKQSQKAEGSDSAIAQSQIAGQPFSNTASQSATAAPPVDTTASGPVGNEAEVKADGDAVASNAAVDANAAIGQTIKQGNSAQQSQKAKDTNNNNNIVQDQTAGEPFTNTASQSATVGQVVGATSAAPVGNIGEVKAGGDAVAVKARVNAGATTDQTIKQGNRTDQSQKAEDSGGNTVQSQIAGQPFTNTASQTATAAPNVGTTSAGPVSNTGEVGAKGDAVASKASVNAGAAIGQTIRQDNSAKQRQEAEDSAGVIGQDQTAGGPFTNSASQTATAAQVVGTTSAAPVFNAGEVKAGGDAVAGKASVNAGVNSAQTLKQGNRADQSQQAADAGTIQQEQIADTLSNQASQVAEVGANVGSVSTSPVSNDAKVKAGGDAVASKASADVGATIGQTIKQDNGAKQSQKAKDADSISQSQSAQTYLNQAEQEATAEPGLGPTTAGAVINGGEVKAGGDAVASRAGVNVGASIGQTLKQSNSAEQSQEAKDAGEITQTQAAQDYSNQAEQNAAVAATVASTTSSTVSNSGKVEAGGDAVASKAGVSAGANIGQKAKQTNSARSTQAADGDEIFQGQEASGQTNQASQGATFARTVDPVTTGLVTNSGPVTAGGDAVASKAEVDVSAKIGQELGQYNSLEQSQTARDGDEIVQGQEANERNNSAAQSATETPVVTATTAGAVGNSGGSIGAKGDAVVSKSRVTATAKLGQKLKQDNSAKQTQKAGEGGEIVQGQEANAYANSASQSARAVPVVNNTVAGAVANSGPVKAGGDAVASMAVVDARSEIGQDARQYNGADQSQSAGGADAIIQSQEADEYSNSVSQEAVVGPAVFTNHAATVDNSGSVEAKGDAVVSKAASGAAVKTGQTVKQANTAEQTRQGGGSQEANAYSNSALQTVLAAPIVNDTASGSVNNNGPVTAGGDAVASKALVDAGSGIGQKIGQYNGAKQSQTAGDGDAIVQGQEANEYANTAAQQGVSLTPSVTATAAGAAGNGSSVKAGGDAVASTAAVNVAANIDQKLKQANSAKQAQTAGEVGAVVQGQEAGTYTNTAGQRVTAAPIVGPTTAGAAGNGGSVTAGGDAVASKALVDAGIGIGQKLGQDNGAKQTQTTGDGDEIVQGQDADEYTNSSTQSASVLPNVTATQAAAAGNGGSVEAKGDAVVSTAGVNAAVAIGQKVKQANSAKQTQTAGDGGEVVQGQEADTYSNEAAQSQASIANVTSTVSGAASNGGPVTAGGDAVASKALVDAGAKGGQDARQYNGAEQSQSAGDGGTIVQGQDADDRSNTAEQGETATALVAATVAGEASNGNSVEAKGDAVVSMAGVNAAAKIGQKAKQDNDAKQTQTAGDGDEIVQDQGASTYLNSASQSASRASNVGATTAGAANNDGSVTAGGDAVASQALVDAGVDLNQEIGQYNGAEQSQTAADTDEIVQNQDADDYTNVAAQNAGVSSTVIGTHAATTVSSGSVKAKGDAVVSTAGVNASVNIGQKLKQANSANQTQAAGDGGETVQNQEAEQYSNSLAQSVGASQLVADTVSGEASNGGSVKAGGDAVASKALVDAGTKTGQEIGEYNGAQQSQIAGDGDDITQTQAATTYTNAGAQSAGLTMNATATHAGAAVNGGSVEAKGDAVVSKALVNAASKSGQKAKQENDAKQTQTAGDGGDIVQDQDAVLFTNSSVQTAATNPIVTDTTAGGVSNSAPVTAGGDAVASKALVDASAEIGQEVDQHNRADQSQAAGNGAGITQGQQTDQYTNSFSQEGTALPTVTTTHAAAVSNTGTVKAGGDAVVSEASVNAAVKLSQKGKQSNSSKQTQQAGDGDNTAQTQTAGSFSNEASQNVGPTVNVTDTVAGEVVNDGSVTAGGDAVSSKAKVNAGIAVKQELGQNNNVDQTQKSGAGTGTAQTQTVNALSNTATQDAAISSNAETPLAGGVTSAGNVNAGGNGVGAQSITDMTLSIDQSADQNNATAQAQDAGDISQNQTTAGQSNTLTQTASVGTAAAGAGPINVTSAGNIKAGATGVGGQSIAGANVTITQKATQSNSSKQSQGSTDGDAVQTQLAGVHSNTATQTALIGNVTATSGVVVVTSVGQVDAGADGVAGQSIASANASIDQALSQTNSYEQSQTAGDGVINQTQTAPTQNNTSTTTGTIADVTATSGNVTVTSTGKVKAKGNGVIGQSVAEASATVNQTNAQSAAGSQNQTAGGGTVTQTATMGNVNHTFANAASRGDVTATSGVVVVQSNGDVSAGGDGVVGTSVARANGFTSQISDQSLNTTNPVQIADPGATQTVVGNTINASGTQSSGGAAVTATAGNVTVGTNGKVNAKGNGVVATSLATSNGTATSGTVAANVNGDVNAGKNGILAASLANDGTGTQGNVNVNVNSGKVTGGTGFWGTVILGGGTNTLNNSGTITSKSELAILGGDKVETVNNFGTVIGVVDLGLGGPQAFNNMVGAQFLSGTLINLDGGTLLNSGILSPGGPNRIMTSNLKGDLVQDDNGTTVIDFNAVRNQSDRINVTGTADMDGSVDAIAHQLSVKPRTYTIISTQGGVTDSGLVLDDVTLPRSIAAGEVDLDLEFTANEVLLQYQLVSVNFAPGGLNRNERAVGVNLNQNFSAGPTNQLAEVMDGLLAIGKFAPYAAALDQLSPQVYLNEMMATYLSDNAFTNDMMSCPVRDGSYVFVEQDQCVWAKVRYRNLDFDHTKQQVGFNEDGGSVSGGVQGIVGPNWRLGFAAGYERADLETDTSQSGDGDRLHVGGVAKYIQGPLLLAGAVTGGFTWYDTTRPMAFGSFSGTTKSSNDVDYISGLFRAAYQVGQGPWYAKPMVDFDVTQVHLDGFTERGSNAALKVSGSDETIFSATPALELGRQSAFAGGTLVRTYVRGGVTFYGDDDFALRSNFVYSSAGVPSFTTVTSIGNVVGDVSAGVTFLAPPGALFSANTSVTVSYDGRFGEDFDENAVSAKASFKF